MARVDTMVQLDRESEPAPSRGRGPGEAAPRAKRGALHAMSAMSSWTSRRRFSVAASAGGALSLVLFVWIVTGGTFAFLQHQLFSNLYDEQAESLLHGHLSMSPSVLSIEAFDTGGRYYMYFGPFLALARMPVLLVDGSLAGRLTPLSMTVGMAVALVAIARLTWKARRLVRGDKRVSNLEMAGTAAWVLLAGAGSVLVFLGSRPSVYQETELWGAALALLAFDAIVGFVAEPSTRSVVLAGLFGAAALLTRGSVGAGPMAALAVLSVAHIAAWAKGRASPGWAAPGHLDWLALGPRVGPLGEVGGARACYAAPLAASVLLPSGAYVLINEVKFHTLVSLPLGRQLYTKMSANRRATLAANHGSLFGAKFVPTAVVQYLRPDAIRFERLFPFLTFPGPATVIGHVRYDTLDWTSSATATMPLLVVLAAIGLVAIFRKRPRPDAAHATRAHATRVPATRVPAFRVAVFGGVVGCVGALEIAYIAQRYIADFFPLVVVCAVVGLQVGVSAVARARSVWRGAVTTLAVVVGLFSVWANVALALDYQRVYEPDVPSTVRYSFVSFQQSLDSRLFGNPPLVSVRRSLPAKAAPGSLLALPNCEGLYQYDGTEFDAVERGPSPGHVRLDVTFPDEPRGVYQPLLVSGSSAAFADTVAVHYHGGGLVSFAYRFSGYGSPWLNGPEAKVVMGRHYVLDVAMDPANHDVSVMMNGTDELQLSYLVRPLTRTTVGYTSFPGPDERTFTGKLRRLEVHAPLCEELVKRLGGSRR